ncbi:MAG: FHA domain-containing protein [Gemmataceae bacterium]|nr:FHA domain-containing protein [Gemmataceae bacterium]
MSDNNNPFEAVAEPMSVPDANPPGIETMPMAAIAAEGVVAPMGEAPPAPAAPTEAPPAALGADAKPKLVVQRGLKINVEYPIYEGNNFIGRADEKPVDIDLDDQEPPDRVWSSRQHALIVFENGVLNLEDLNSANGTFVNRTRVYPGQKRALAVNDVVQVGTVQLKVKV